MSGLVTSNPDNANPTVHKTAAEKHSKLGAFLDDDFDEEELDLTYSGAESSSGSDMDEDGASKKGEASDEPIDAQEVYDLIRSITDPEHPLTLEQLAVVSEEQIQVIHGDKPKVLVEFKPTIPHCSMATLIGMSF